MATLNRALQMAETGQAAANLNNEILAIGRDVIQREAAALRLLEKSLDHHFADAVEALLRHKRRIIVTGLGKSGQIGRKFAATLAATGTPAFFIHASEAAHGDLGMLMEGDMLIALSKSGYTRELNPILLHAKRLNATVIALCSMPQSPLACAADIVVHIPRALEACPARIAPTTSSTMMLALGDALALAVMHRRGIGREHVARLHPGGEIGFRLSPIDEAIDLDAPLPLVCQDAPMRDVVFQMTSAGKGVACVVDHNGNLIGAITDGDIRRQFDQVLTATAADLMSPHPICVPSGTVVEDVLATMSEEKITVVFVTDAKAPGKPIGIAHIHDIAPSV